MATNYEHLAEPPGSASWRPNSGSEKPLLVGKGRSASDVGSRVWRALAVLGPGLVTGASDDDPSGIATYSQVACRLMRCHIRSRLAKNRLCMMWRNGDTCGTSGAGFLPSTSKQALIGACGSAGDSCAVNS